MSFLEKEIEVPEHEQEYYERRLVNELIEQHSPSVLFAAFSKSVPFEKQITIAEFVGINTDCEMVRLAYTENGLAKASKNISDFYSANSTKESETAKLAKALSYCLNHESLPKQLYDVMHQKLGVMEQPIEQIDSAPYIQQILEAEKEKE